MLEIAKFGRFLLSFSVQNIQIESMATTMCKAIRNVDYLVLYHSKQKRKISAKSVTMRGTNF